MKKFAAILVLCCLIVGCLTTTQAGGQRAKENFARSPQKQSSHLYKARPSKKPLQDIIRGNDSYEERLNKEAKRSATEARKKAIEAQVKFHQAQKRAELEIKTGLKENKFQKLSRWYMFLSLIVGIFIVKKVYKSSTKV